MYFPVKYHILLLVAITITGFDTPVCSGQETIKQDCHRNDSINHYIFRKCDILVNPNHNLLPGTTFVPGGSNFGHAVIVLEDVVGTDFDSALFTTPVFEVCPTGITEGSCLEVTMAQTTKKIKSSVHKALHQSEAGFRYRLRLDVDVHQKDSIIVFLKNQEHHEFNWCAAKTFKRASSNVQNAWYCSLIIWQAIYNVLGIDPDANGGYYIYPNDLINSPVFSNTLDGVPCRIKF